MQHSCNPWRQVEMDALGNSEYLLIRSTDTQASLATKHTDNVADASCRDKRPGLEEPKSIDIESLGVNVVGKDARSQEWRVGVLTPHISNQLLVHCRPH